MQPRRPASADSPGSIACPRFDRPVFIVAAPRSGSTLLFETLAVNRDLWTVGDESHKQFESIPELRPAPPNPSNRLTGEAATPDVIDKLHKNFIADLVNANGGRYTRITADNRPKEIRLLEKTPKNSLRIPFITEAFPEARFIFLFREARQNISSLLDSWRSGRYVTYPRLPGWPSETPWSHLLIPGWQDLASCSLAQVVTRQWLDTNRIILEDLQAVPRDRWMAIEYDSLLANTRSELMRMCAFAELVFGPRMKKIAAAPLRHSKYTLTAPHPDKWKKNATELEPVLPDCKQMMKTLLDLVRP